MTEQRRAQIVTVAVLAAVVVFLAVRQTGWPPSWRDQPPPAELTPQDAIYAMLDAARAGDVDAYLEHYTGQIRAALEQAVAEKQRRGFADYLRASNASIKGIAVTEPERLSPAEVKARVEYVYADRNEVQHMYLQQTGGRWLIHRVDAAQRIETTIPYGTPVE